jgi:hypothetical protein
MSAAQLVGAAMILAFFAGLFALVARSIGPKEAAVGFGISIAATGFLVGAVYLLVGGAA